MTQVQVFPGQEGPGFGNIERSNEPPAKTGHREIHGKPVLLILLRFQSRSANQSGWGARRSIRSIWPMEHGKSHLHNKEAMPKRNRINPKNTELRSWEFLHRTPTSPPFWKVYDCRSGRGCSNDFRKMLLKLLCFSSI